MLFLEKSRSAFSGISCPLGPISTMRLDWKDLGLIVFVKMQSRGPLVAISNEIIFKSPCCKAIIVLLELAMKNNFCFKKKWRKQCYFIWM